MIETVFALAILTQLLVPGYIYRSFRKRFFTVESEAHAEETLIAFAVASLVIHAITWPAFAVFGFDPMGSLIAAKDASAFLAEIAASPLRWFLQLVVAPMILSIFVAYAERQAWGTDFFSKIGLPPLPNRPSAITAAIHHHRQADAIVEVLLKDGKSVVGRLGPNSAVSAEKGYPDIFMDATYLPTPQGTWLEDEESSGMIVMGSEIRLIQFFLNPEITGKEEEIEEDEEEIESPERDSLLLAVDKGLTVAETLQAAHRRRIEDLANGPLLPRDHYFQDLNAKEAAISNARTALARLAPTQKRLDELDNEEVCDLNDLDAPRATDA